MIFPRSFIQTACFLLCVLTVATRTIYTITNEDTHLQPSNGTFMYFAYGSNLLSKRILLQNPTAKRRAIGVLKNYRLDFNVYTRIWDGCSATIVEKNGSDVWGAIWEIDMANMEDLDRQEGVDVKMYKALTKSVEAPGGQKITCRLYQKIKKPKPTYRFEDIPLDRQPSRTYMNCILKGAVESKLPIEYINDLKKIPHNHRNASDPRLNLLNCD